MKKKLCLWFRSKCHNFISEVPVRKDTQLKLNVKFSRQPRECQLVAKSLDITPSVSGQSDSRSIVGLLNTPWISSVLQNVQFDRDKDTSLLSPVKSR